MKIFKFGGASVKDGEGIKNITKILKNQGTEQTLVVVSAMGKMTNALEEVVNSYYFKKKDLLEKLNFVSDFHKQIIKSLFEEGHPVYRQVNSLFAQLNNFIENNNSKNYNYVYDQIICFGELASTKIVSNYLSKIGVQNNWLDVRNFIKTDSCYREAKVNWGLTKNIVQNKIDTYELNITQGFLSANETDQTTTLGREGSDYSAAIFAYLLKAESVTIWKDVDGVLNADPRIFKNTQLINQISYQEAIEMAFYGASVIHPKTIQPLKKASIPLYVRSFKNPDKQGTKVSNGADLEPKIPCFIAKKNQILISILASDFSFMVENNMSYIFKKLHEFKLKVNLMQNSAISFSVCAEDKFCNFDSFYQAISSGFKIKYQKGVTLYTIRHFDQKALDDIKQKSDVLLKQSNGQTAQLVVR